MGPGLPGSFNFQLPEGAGRVEAKQQLDATQKETMKRMMRQMKELEQRMEEMQREFHETLPTAPAPADDPSKT